MNRLLRASAFPVRTFVLICFILLSSAGDGQWYTARVAELVTGAVIFDGYKEHRKWGL